MFDAQPCSLDLPFADSATSAALVRSEGAVRLSLKRRGDLTAIDRLFQSGCLKARFATPDPRRTGDAVLINTAGGLTGGDVLAIELSWGTGTRSTVTSQAAEKIYRSLSDVARIRTTIEVGQGASGEWLPQETILFDRAALDRDTVVRLAPDACFLGLEAVVLGRHAMGETVVTGALRDAWRVWRGGKLIYADAFELRGAIAASLRHPAIGNGAAAFASLLWIGAEPLAMRDRLRAALAGAELCGVSSWNGLVAVRLAAPDGARLRRRILDALHVLRDGSKPPGVWQC
jgi:urease accessory protein